MPHKSKACVLFDGWAKLHGDWVALKCTRTVYNLLVVLAGEPQSINFWAKTGRLYAAAAIAQVPARIPAVPQRRCCSYPAQTRHAKKSVKRKKKKKKTPQMLGDPPWRGVAPFVSTESFFRP